MIKIANIHEMRIQSAINRIGHLFPMNEDTLKNISDDDFVWIDLLVNRFRKLQDIIGSKILDLFLEQQQEETYDLSVLDKINKLEKLGIIEDAGIWKEMRKTRNHIAHEYPDMPALMAIYLNQIFDLSPKLISIFLISKIT